MPAVAGGAQITAVPPFPAACAGKQRPAFCRHSGSGCSGERGARYLGAARSHQPRPSQIAWRHGQPAHPDPAVSANMERSGKRLPPAGGTQVTVVPTGCRARIQHLHQQGLRGTRHFVGTRTCRRAQCGHLRAAESGLLRQRTWTRLARPARACAMAGGCVSDLSETRRRSRSRDRPVPAAIPRTCGPDRLPARRGWRAKTGGARASEQVVTWAAAHRQAGKISCLSPRCRFDS